MLMTAYEELLEFGGERIFDFLKNARLHESQFKYSEFNEVCYKKMYIENNQDNLTDSSGISLSSSRQSPIL